MKKQKITAILMAVSFAAAALSGCNTDPDAGSSTQTSGGSTAAESTGENSSESSEKIVRIGTISSPSGIFNPLYSSDDWTGYVVSLVYEPLLSIDEKAEYKGDLAKSWEISQDSKTVTFHLVDNAKWTDGEPFTAEDVKFTLEFMSDPEYTGLNSTYVSPIAGYEDYHSGKADTLSGVNVVDDHTVEITTTDVYASFLEKIGRSLRIIPEHIWKDVDVATADQNTDLLQNPVGLGPFEVTEYVPDQYTVLKKNADYFKGEPKLDEIVVQVINADTVQAQVLNGEIDVLRLESSNPDDLDEYKNAGVQVFNTRLNAFQHMVPNFNNKYLADKTVRQALAHAINRQGIVDSQLYGYGAVANTLYTEGFWAYPGADKLDTYDYDPEKAKELLTGDGFSYKGDKLYDADGNQVTFRLIYPSGNKAREGAAAVIQQNLGEIGIDVDLQLMEFAAMSAQIQKHDDSYDLALIGNGFGADADVTQLVGTGGTNNHSGYSSDEMDELLAKGVSYIDNETRQPIYEEIAKLANEDLPTIYLYNWDRFTVVNSKVKNVSVTPYSFYDGVENWDIQ